MGHNPPLPAVARNHAMPKKKIAARLSPIHGNGVFATEAIEKGERIVRYKGMLRTHDEVDEEYGDRSEEHTSELPSLMRTSYAVICLKNKHHTCNTRTNQQDKPT